MAGASSSSWPISARRRWRVEAVRRIDAIFAIERDDQRRCRPSERLAVRQERVAPLVAELEDWMRAERARLSRHADVAKAIDYMLKRWPAFTRFLDDGRICLTQQRRRARAARHRPRAPQLVVRRSDGALHAADLIMRLIN